MCNILFWDILLLNVGDHCYRKPSKDETWRFHSSHRVLFFLEFQKLAGQAGYQSHPKAYSCIIVIIILASTKTEEAALRTSLNFLVCKMKDSPFLRSQPLLEAEDSVVASLNELRL